jgi:hypothetical protein
MFWFIPPKPATEHGEPVRVIARRHARRLATLACRLENLQFLLFTKALTMSPLTFSIQHHVSIASNERLTRAIQPADFSVFLDDCRSD